MREALITAAGRMLPEAQDRIERSQQYISTISTTVRFLYHFNVLLFYIFTRFRPESLFIVATYDLEPLCMFHLISNLFMVTRSKSKHCSKAVHICMPLMEE